MKLIETVPKNKVAKMLKSYVFMVIRLVKLLFLMLLLPFLCFCQEISAQESIPNPADYKYKQWKKAISIWQVEHLKEGVLLVRLTTRRKSSTALRQAGNEEKAAQIEKETEILNSAIIQGFKTSFDFCDVYFFESDYSDLVRAHNLTSVKFVDEVVHGESKGDLSNVNFLVAEFAALAPDTVKGKSLNKPGYGVGNQTTSTYSNSNMGISGLVVKSDQFVQLVDPFPYYVRTFGNMSLLERSPVESITALNEKLHEFYSKRNLLTAQKKRSVRKAESSAEK